MSDLVCWQFQYCRVKIIEYSRQPGVQISFSVLGLAVFIGLICKKYVFDTAGLLQYIANQLKAERNFDLVILKELLSKMSGVTVFEDITNDELFALGGGELLKSEASIAARESKG